MTQQNAIFLGLALIGIPTLQGCSDPNLRYANALAASLASFDRQKSETCPVVESAQDTLRSAQHVDFKPESPETREFRQNWSRAADSVADLRRQYNDVIKSADFHFQFINDKIGSMSTPEIKDRLKSHVGEKKAVFADAANRSDEAIDALETIVRRGNDIIKALDVLNALDAVSDDSVALLDLIDDANDMMPVLDELVSVGNSIVDLKLDD